MIVVTRSGDTKAKAAFGRSNVVVSSLDTITHQLSIDPELIQGNVEAYIVYEADVHGAKAKQDFITAVANKHSSHKVIVVGKRAGAFQEGQGIDKVLINPKLEDLNRTVESLLVTVTEKDIDVQDALENIEQSEIPNYIPDIPEAVDEQSVESTTDTVVDEPVILPEFEDEKSDDVSPVMEESGPSLVQRIKECHTVAEVRMMSQQMTAQEVIKDIVKSNNQYAMVEEKLKVLREKIIAVFAENSGLTIEEKLNKVNAIVIDKNYYRDENNTVIEQQVDSIVKAITGQTVKLISDRLAELDKAILSTKNNNVTVDYGRLAGITDERANLLLELATVENEINTIYANTNKMVKDTVSDIARESSVMTDSVLVDAQLRAHNADIVSGKTYEVMSELLESCDKSSSEFMDVVKQVKVMYRTVEQIIDKDKEVISALTQIISLMKANKIEDTVVAETFLKKSLRVFIGRSGEGKSVIPYVLSKNKSRTNANVLLVDLTGSSNIPQYTDEYCTLQDYVENRYEKDFCCVVGNPENTAEMGQKLLVLLTKAAEYYRVINVILTPEQVELFDVIASDVLVVNYIVNPYNETINFYKKFIADTRMENVAQRVILNRCDVQIQPILQGLDLMDRIDYQYAHIGYVPQLVQCALVHTAPDVLTSVKEAFREVSESC